MYFSSCSISKRKLTILSASAFLLFILSAMVCPNWMHVWCKLNSIWTNFYPPQFFITMLGLDTLHFIGNKTETSTFDATRRFTSFMKTQLPIHHKNIKQNLWSQHHDCVNIMKRELTWRNPLEIIGREWPDKLAVCNKVLFYS